MEGHGQKIASRLSVRSCPDGSAWRRSAPGRPDSRHAAGDPKGLDRRDERDLRQRARAYRYGGDRVSKCDACAIDDRQYRVAHRDRDVRAANTASEVEEG